MQIMTNPYVSNLN